ncbi:hypothetical protein [Bacillus sp. AFS088145]|uniref:hypothetical protein n=1 Tax=Bacillus sp. AFS088145 TaxID=2033514 RepID=UPI000BF8F66C|nr:hypothetical protein [Bacillus sp. AFS088145]PFH81984.1 hypothetical protein COI44_22130 [Bacillus sp. AFS088145]
MKDYMANYCFNVDDIVGEHDDFGVSIDFDGNLVLLSEKKEKTRYVHIIFHFLDGEIKKIYLPKVKNSYTYAQPMDDNWLLVSSRTDYEDELNATIYDTYGNFLEKFSLDDAIEDVQTTKSSNIWVSYFDENMDSGLSCFNNKGQLSFKFNEFVGQTNKQLPYIADCYALNVTSDETVFIYYYSDFPLVKLTNNSFEIIKNIPIKGSSAIAIHEDYALFEHGYGQKGKMHLYSMRNKSLKNFNLLNKIGKVLNYDYAVGRGSKLYLIKDKDVYLLNLEDFLNKLC